HHGRASVLLPELLRRLRLRTPGHQPLRQRSPLRHHVRSLSPVRPPCHPLRGRPREGHTRMTGARGFTPGQALPLYTVRANNTSTASENKIHDDSVARLYGFSGGLVPGVDVYAYMTHPVVHALGRDWLQTTQLR